MRRKDREITDFNEIIDIIKHCDVCRIAMHDDEYPYMVPMNFGLDIVDGQIYLYFHCAKDGKKVELLRKNPKVMFEMDCEHIFILYEERMSCTMGYKSVMGYGIMEFVEENDKLKALQILMRQYHAEEFKFNTNMIAVTEVLRLKVTSMTGKYRNNKH